MKSEVKGETRVGQIGRVTFSGITIPIPLRSGGFKDEDKAVPFNKIYVIKAVDGVVELNLKIKCKPVVESCLLAQRSSCTLVSQGVSLEGHGE